MRWDVQCFPQAGQIDWIEGITSVLNGLPSSHGKGKPYHTVPYPSSSESDVLLSPRCAGILYWEPTWLQNANLGSACADNLLFDQSGTARSSVK